MTYHLNVSDVKQWYEERYPRLPLGSIVPGRCFYCWAELNVGDQVVVRGSLGNDSPIPVGTRGVIHEILSGEEDGSIYVVQLVTGEERYLIRAELRKPHEGEA
jgi:hypothetical protein